MRRLILCPAVLPLLACAFCAQTKSAHAQIVTDGSLGQALALNGPNFQIPSSLGRIVGKNLFHSFQDFNLSNGESATFSGPASISNILSRITGGNPSSIDGSLNSTIAGANFFFINPSGIVFGPNAQVNVGGSFVATTSDLVNLKDGGVFDASNPSSTVLTSAAPASFGFLTAQPAPIFLDGALLQGNQGQSLSLIGGDIGLSDGIVAAAQGKLNVVSVGSAGQVAFDASNPGIAPTLSGFNKLGSISLDGSAIVTDDDPNFFNTGTGGSVSVQGQDLTLNNGSVIGTTNSGAATGGSIAVNLGGNLKISNESSISALNGGSGVGADVTVKADTIDAQGPDLNGQHNLTGIESTVSTVGTGKSGKVNVESRDLTLSNGARISSTTAGQGDSGDLTVKADTITLDGGTVLDLTGITAQTLASNGGGKGGNLIVDAKNLNVLSGAELSTSSSGSGTGGRMQVTADNVTLDGKNNQFVTGLVAGTFAQDGGGDGGGIQLKANNLQILNGSVIDADTQGNGQGGKIDVTADNILIDRQGAALATGITASTISTPNGGHGGDIAVKAKSLSIRNGGEISTDTSGSGAGGSVQINADNLSIDAAGENGFTGISANTESELTSGMGGTVDVTSKNLQIVNGGTITAFTVGGSEGGSITVHADDVTLDGQGADHFTGLSSQTAADSHGGKAGEINLTAKDLHIVNGSEISSASFGSGRGGNVVVTADNITLDNQNSQSFTGIEAETSAADRGGQGGGITLHAKNLQLLNGSGIFANTRGSGNGGRIDVHADSTLIDGHNSKTGIAAGSLGVAATGQSGDIVLQAGDLRILRGGYIDASTTGPGASGKIDVTANSILLDSKGSDFNTDIAAETGGDGAGGDITLHAKDLKVMDGAIISANAFGRGQGGSIHIVAKRVTLDNKNSPFATGITAGTKSADQGGHGGDVTIESNDLKIVNEALISTSSLGSGTGGKIDIHSGDLTLNRGLITSEARGTGDAGAVNIATTGSVNLTGDSGILVTSNASNGGDIVVNSGNSIRVDDSSISAQANGDGGGVQLQAGKFLIIKNGILSAKATGNGGNLTSSARFIILDRSQVLASAINGNGGNILFRSKVYLPSIESIVDASSQFGVNGNVAIESPNTNLGGSLVTLPSNLLSAENYLAPRCDVRVTGGNSSFTVDPQNGVPVQPGDMLPSPSAKKSK